MLCHLGLVVDGFLPVIKQDVHKLDYFEKLIYDTLTYDAMHIDDIVEKTKLPISKCMNVLMSLELTGFEETTLNNFYRKKE